MEYIVKSNLKHDGVLYEVDSVIEMDADIARDLVNEGILVALRAPKEEKAAPAKPASRSKAKKEEEKAEEIEEVATEDEDSSDGEEEIEEVVNNGDDL